METISRIVAVVLLVIFIFFVPMILYTENADAVTQQAVQAYTVSFVEDIKKQGKITQSMYNQYVSELGATGHTYNIEFTHAHVFVQPIFDGSQVIGSKQYEDHYYTNDIVNTLFAKQLSQEEIDAGVVAGEYHFNKGDYFTVEIINKDRTMATYFRNLFYGRNHSASSAIHVIYGGTIEDENY